MAEAVAVACKARLLDSVHSIGCDFQLVGPTVAPPYVEVHQEVELHMAAAALFISIVSLIIAAISYYRSGGEREIRALEQRLLAKIEVLGAMIHRVSESISGRVNAGYLRSIRMISDLQSQVAELKEKAAEEIRDDLKKVTQTLDGLASRAARELKGLTADATLVVVEAELSLRRAVEEAKARLRVIEAKQELSLARNAVEVNDLNAAEARVEPALKYLKEAQSLTVKHVESVTGLYRQAQQMLLTIRAKAGTVKTDLDALMSRSDRLLREMTESSAQPTRNAA
jgi:hypothetical protein